MMQTTEWEITEITKRQITHGMRTYCKRSEQLFLRNWSLRYEPRCEKTGLRDFRPGPT